VTAKITDQVSNSLRAAPQSRQSVSLRSGSQRGPQTERTTSFRSGVAGSFVRSGTTNSWAPPMPSCIVKASVSVVEPPGRMVVCPTTASGGQHPLTTSTRGTPTIRSTPSPVLANMKTARTGASNRT